MIHRVWTATAAESKLDAYLAHLSRNVIPELRSLPGFAGATAITRAQGGQTEIVVTTAWTSREAIQAFAGADVEAAVVPEEAAALLTAFDRRVKHYDVRLSDPPR
jgi:heme-degrading monooxygenase HmoA